MTPASDIASYRQALGRFPTGVAFVGACAPDGTRVGLLINSFTSVSLDPPLVLWCLGLGASCRPLFSAASSFAISILTREQQHLLEALGRRQEQRLQGVPWRDGLGGAPVIENAAASFECSVMSVTRAGDHEIFLGQVERFGRCDDAPLAYLAGRYGCVEIAA